MQANRVFHSIILFLLLTCSTSVAAKERYLYVKSLTGWAAVDSLVQKANFNAACAVLADTVAKAAEQDNPSTFARAMVPIMQLRLLQGEPAKAINLLLKKPVPAGARDNRPLLLYQAICLKQFLKSNRYRFSSGRLQPPLEPLSLETFAQVAIRKRMLECLHQAWQISRSQEPPQDHLEHYVDPGNWPANIRNRPVDIVGVVYADYLQGEAATDLRGNPDPLLKRDLPLLLQPLADDAADGPPAEHPLVQASRVLRALEANNRGIGRPEAALDFRMLLLEMLWAFQHAGVDPAVIREDLKGHLEGMDPALPWWSMGMYRLGRYHEADSGALNRILAHAAYCRGEVRHPHSMGGRWCRRGRETLEEKSFDIQAMRQDGPGRRTLLVNHRNLDRVFLRAWRMQPESYFSGEGIWPLDLRRDPSLNLLKNKEPDLEWSVELNDPNDYHKHQTYVAMPAEARGLYHVAVSQEENFPLQPNRIRTVDIFVGNLVLLMEEESEGLVFRTLRGTRGTALPRQPLWVQTVGFKNGMASPYRLQADAAGMVTLPRQVHARQIRALAGVDTLGSLLQTQVRHFNLTPTMATYCLIFTSQAIYRPGQDIHWKAVVFQEDAVTGLPRARSGYPLTLTLESPHGDQVAKVTRKTNAFGSCSGSFPSSPKAPLGRYRITSDPGEFHSIRVEEYRRPTMECRWLPDVQEHHLGQLVSVRGKVTYLFGSPVGHGLVEWRIEREKIHLPPLEGARHGTYHESREVASGVDTLGTDGLFQVDFLPEPMDNSGIPLPAHTFRIEARIIGGGNETLVARTRLTVHSCALKAKIASLPGFIREGLQSEITIQRSLQQGGGARGSGTFRIVRLDWPQVARLASQVPRPQDEVRPAPFRTEGDSLKPRWHGNASRWGHEQSWPESAVVQTGDLEHGPDGVGLLRLKGLPRGAYRLHYETRDASGVRTTIRQDFVVAGSEPMPSPFPLELVAEKRRLEVSDTARILVLCGLPDQTIHVQMRTRNGLHRRWTLETGKSEQILEFPVTVEMRGGVSVSAQVLRDFQLVERSLTLTVPHEEARLQVELETFRDPLTCGEMETIRLRVRGADGKPLTTADAEVLALMYDRSLETLSPFRMPDPGRYFPERRPPAPLHASLDNSHATNRHGTWLDPYTLVPPLHAPRLQYLTLRRERGSGEMRLYGGPPEIADTLMSLDSAISSSMAMEVEGAQYMVDVKSAFALVRNEDDETITLDGGLPGSDVRQDFTPSAFFLPHVTLDDDGWATFEFRVPDSASGWVFQALALTPELHFGRVVNRTTSRKPLLVRPYLPRFLREGDEATVAIVLTNGTQEDLECRLDAVIQAEGSGEDISSSFGLKPDDSRGRPVKVPAGDESIIRLTLQVPEGIGLPSLQVQVTTANLSDGEKRTLPILPGHTRLKQSRFASLMGPGQAVLKFNAPAEAASFDPEKLVVTVDARLFESTLRALPYLVNYPYECTEQLLNRYMSSGILSGLLRQHPALQETLEANHERTTRFPSWDKTDPNRALVLEETPWLRASSGGKTSNLTAFLDSTGIAELETSALAELRKRQAEDGGFAWFPGGQPSASMTMYVLTSLARGELFGMQAPDPLIRSAWRFLAENPEHSPHPDEVISARRAARLTFTASCFARDNLARALPDSNLRRYWLDQAFYNWQQLDRLPRAQLALALHRMGRRSDARLILDAILDEAVTDPLTGMHWPANMGAWRWYRAPIEGQALLLLAMVEIHPDDPRTTDMVKWLLLNRQLGIWRSTRATAEVLHALAIYLQKQGPLTGPQEVLASVGNQQHMFGFEDSRKGFDTWVLGPEELPRTEPPRVTISSEDHRPTLATATWHFKTATPPTAGDGDLLGIDRTFGRRVQENGHDRFIPLQPGELIRIGEVIHVRLVLNSRQRLQYLHLRDPRPAGFEPLHSLSGWNWYGAVDGYREIRDNAFHLFIEKLDPGQAEVWHALRATVTGSFMAQPATLQSMYAPEHNAYSAGERLTLLR